MFTQERKIDISNKVIVIRNAKMERATAITIMKNAQKNVVTNS